MKNTKFFQLRITTTIAFSLNLLSFIMPMASKVEAALSVPALAHSAIAQADNIGQVSNSRLAVVINRGQLLCGVEGTIPGLSFVDAQGRYSGLDVDICRAVAAAVLGDSNLVEYRNLSSTNRFPALANGEVDLLSRNSTWTASRDATHGNGFNFAPPTLFDGQGMMVRRSSGITRLQDLQGKSVCVERDTLTEPRQSIAAEPAA
jgi:ABC-type amino acid transport substrate-binding protein